MSSETELAVLKSMAALHENYMGECADPDTLDYIADALHYHFEDFGRWDWCEIAEEIRRVWKLLFDENVEFDSPMDCVWTAGVAQAYNGAVAGVAAALGVEPRDLQSAVEPWLENQDAPPPPVPAERLLALCEDAANARRRWQSAKECGHG